MGDSISEGSIKSWEKKVGERVEVDEVVAIIDTDKVSGCFLNEIISHLTLFRGIGL